MEYVLMFADVAMLMVRLKPSSPSTTLTVTVCSIWKNSAECSRTSLTRRYRGDCDCYESDADKVFPGQSHYSLEARLTIE